MAARIPLIRNCERCGRLICSRCTRSRVIGNQCVQCLNAFATGSSADVKALRTKRAQMARYQAWLKFLPRTLSVIFPGAGHLVWGRSKEGILYLFIFILFLTKVSLWIRGVPNPLVLYPSVSIPWVIVAGLLYLLFYLGVQWRMNRIQTKGGKLYFRRA